MIRAISAHMPWEGLLVLAGALSVLWMMKQAFDEGVGRIVKKLDEVIDILKKSRPE